MTDQTNAGMDPAPDAGSGAAEPVTDHPSDPAADPAAAAPGEAATEPVAEPSGQGVGGGGGSAVAADGSNRAALAELVEGRSDEEINQFAAQLGVDALLDQIFEAMRAAFVPERAAGQNAVAQWDVVAPDGTRTYQLKMADGTCTLSPAAVDPPKVTLTLALPDFLRLVGGKLDGMQAFMSGKLRLSGDMMFATTMQSWFAQ